MRRTKLGETWLGHGKPPRRINCEHGIAWRKFLLRHGRRPAMGVQLWTLKYMEWVKREVRFEQPAQEVTLLDYVHEVDHAAARIVRLDLAIAEAAKSVPPKMRAVIEALQALRGIAQVSAVTIVSELGEVSRFPGARQLMG
jgi:transposase